VAQAALIHHPANWPDLISFTPLTVRDHQIESRKVPKTNVPEQVEPSLTVATHVNVRRVDVFNVRGHKNTNPSASPAKIVVLLLFSICTPHVAMPTTVMAVFTPTLVTIGVDGLGTYHLEGKDIPVKACKVLATEDTIYVASGDIPERIKENVLSIVDWFAASDDTLNSSALRFSVESMMAKNRANDPVRYSKYTPGARVLTFHVARPNHGRIWFRATYFVVTQLGNVTAGHLDFRDASIPFDSAAAHYLPQIPKDFATADPIKLIRRGIRAAFEQPDSASGPPLTIVQVTPKKIHWVAYGNCKDDGSNAWDTTPPEVPRPRRRSPKR
jgi:hypothetical protein